MREGNAGEESSCVAAMGSSPLGEGPGDRNHALAECGDLLEGAFGKIDGVTVLAGRARVCNCNSNGLLVRRVSDIDLLPTEAGLGPKVSITFTINCGNQISVLMDCTTGSRGVILIEEGCKSTSVDVQ